MLRRRRQEGLSLDTYIVATQANLWPMQWSRWSAEAHNVIRLRERLLTEATDFAIWILDSTTWQHTSRSFLGSSTGWNQEERCGARS